MLFFIRFVLLLDFIFDVYVYFGCVLVRVFMGVWKLKASCCKFVVLAAWILGWFVHILGRTGNSAQNVYVLAFINFLWQEPQFIWRNNKQSCNSTGNNSVADRGGRGGRDGHAPLPGPVKISHKKDGCLRRPHRFHVSRPPPYPATGSATVTKATAPLCLLGISFQNFNQIICHFCLIP